MIIKLKFSDFWSHFDPKNNYFYNLLNQHFNIELSDDPDFIIYSNYGEEFLKYDCYRIFYNGENQRIKWNACDFSFSFDYLEDSRHYRLPNWIWYEDPAKLTKRIADVETIISQKILFCNMVVSNPNAKKRIDFFHKLNTYKRVDSGGRYLNNIGGPIEDKIDFISRYKFTLAFENSQYPGYTTEKLLEPFFANSIPIYWGNPEVHRDFNTKSFVNTNQFNNDEDLIEYILYLDNNDDAYKAMLAEPCFVNNKLPDCLVEENIVNRFKEIFNENRLSTPVAQTYRCKLYYIQNKYHKLEHLLNSKLGFKSNFR